MNEQPKPTCQMLACTKNCKVKCWFAAIQQGGKAKRRKRLFSERPEVKGLKGWGGIG